MIWRLCILLVSLAADAAALSLDHHAAELLPKSSSRSEERARRLSLASVAATPKQHQHSSPGSHKLQAPLSPHDSPLSQHDGPWDDDGWPDEDDQLLYDDKDIVCELKSAHEKLTSWLVVLTNIFFIVPACFAWKAGMVYKSLIFVILLFWSGFYHVMDSCLWIPSHSAWEVYRVAQDMDFFFSYYVFVMMALTALGPEDEFQLRGDGAKWLWTQRVSTFVLLGILLGRHDGAKFETAFNAPFLAAFATLWCIFYYGAFSMKPFGFAPHHRLAGETVAAVAALAVYGYAETALGPYWMWHSIWHVLDASLCSCVLLARLSNSWHSAGASDAAALHQQ